MGLLFWVEMLNLPVLVDCTSRAAARALVLWFSRFFYFHFFGLFGLILIGSSAPSLSCCDNSVSIPSIVLSPFSLHLSILSVCLLFNVFLFMYFAVVSTLYIFSCSCCVVCYVLDYIIGVLSHLVLLLLLLMCRLAVYITVYPMRFCFHGSSNATAVVYFGISTFSWVFSQRCTTPPTPITAVQFGTLLPYILLHCRRTVWYIATLRFGSILSPSQRHW